jgi:hypothetical protein
LIEFSKEKTDTTSFYDNGFCAWGNVGLGISGHDKKLGGIVCIAEAESNFRRHFYEVVRHNLHSGRP